MIASPASCHRRVTSLPLPTFPPERPFPGSVISSRGALIVPSHVSPPAKPLAHVRPAPGSPPSKSGVFYFVAMPRRFGRRHRHPSRRTFQKPPEKLPASPSPRLGLTGDFKPPRLVTLVYLPQFRFCGLDGEGSPPPQQRWTGPLGWGWDQPRFLKTPNRILGRFGGRLIFGHFGHATTPMRKMAPLTKVSKLLEPARHLSFTPAQSAHSPTLQGVEIIGGSDIRCVWGFGGWYAPTPPP